MVSIYYESETQLIIGVTLPDGREFSIDIGGPTSKSDNDKLIKDKESIILVSARVSGLASK